MARNNQLAEYVEWNRLALESWALCVEASGVIWLRMMKLGAGGPKASRESRLMVEEKLLANWELGWKLLATPSKTPQRNARRTVRHYRQKVRANQRRLSR